MFSHDIDLVSGDFRDRSSGQPTLSFRRAAREIFWCSNRRSVHRVACRVEYRSRDRKTSMAVVATRALVATGLPGADGRAKRGSDGLTCPRAFRLAGVSGRRSPRSRLRSCRHQGRESGADASVGTSIHVNLPSSSVSAAGGRRGHPLMCAWGDGARGRVPDGGVLTWC